MVLANFVFVLQTIAIQQTATIFFVLFKFSFNFFVTEPLFQFAIFRKILNFDRYKESFLRKLLKIRKTELTERKIERIASTSIENVIKQALGFAVSLVVILKKRQLLLIGQIAIATKNRSVIYI